MVVRYPGHGLSIAASRTVSGPGEQGHATRLNRNDLVYDTPSAANGLVSRGADGPAIGSSPDRRPVMSGPLVRPSRVDPGFSDTHPAWLARQR